MIRAETLVHEDGSVSIVSKPDHFAPEADIVEQRLQTERVNETRYTRTFTSNEVVEILKKEMLKQTSQPTYMHERAVVDVVSSEFVPDITIKAVVKEFGY